MKAKTKLLVPGILSFVTLLACERKGELNAIYGIEEEHMILELTAEDEMIADAADFYYQLFGQEMAREFNATAAYSNGEVPRSRRPYSDYWFPESSGGTNEPVSSGEEGALTLYDKAFHNGAAKSSEWEKKNHSSDVSWYGHCNGFSTSVSRHQLAERSVFRPAGCTPGSSGCVEFKPHHIRALLAEVYMNAKARFLGGRRCNLESSQLRKDPQNRDDPTVFDACDDVGPGPFHLALVNWIGIKGQPLIYDQSRDIQVWNFPVYRYTFSAADISKAQAIDLTGRSGASDYEFNPKATSFKRVHMRVFYADAYDGFEINIPNAPDNANPGDALEGDGFEDYVYVLELDETGDIIGGEWIKDSVVIGGKTKEINSRTEHPDFVWQAFEPFEPTGARKFGNPHVSPKEVIKLWAESMGFDPNDPFADPKNPNFVLNFPVTDKNWGILQQYFSVTLDGTNSGAVFLGKKTKLSIKRGPRLEGDAKVSVALNGKHIANIKLSGDTAETEFDAPAGMSSLEFQWSVDGKQVAEANTTFRFFAVR
jgi:hypothetical protein